MASLQDPVLSYHVGANDAAPVNDATPAPKNKVSLQGPLRKVYSISNVYGVVLAKSCAGLKEQVVHCVFHALLSRIVKYSISIHHQDLWKQTKMEQNNLRTQSIHTEKNPCLLPQ